MKVNLSLSPEEARSLMAAVEFVQSNSTLEPGSLRFLFRDGKPFSASIEGWLGLGYVQAKIEEAFSEEANQVRFAGYCKTF